MKNYFVGGLKTTSPFLCSCAHADDVRDLPDAQLHELLNDLHGVGHAELVVMTPKDTVYGGIKV